MSDDVIRLTGLRVHGFHGVLPEERASGQPFVVDLEIRTRFDAAVSSDDLADTVDYAAVAQTVADIVAGPPRNLIEALADDIAVAVLDDARVRSVRVLLRKPEAPIPLTFTEVAVDIERHRP